MLVNQLLAAAGGLFALASGAPLATRDSYRVFGGDGSMAQGWPDVNSWVGSYDNM